MPVRIPGYDFPVLVRPCTADVSTFKKIFVWRGYDLHYPFQPRVILDAGANIGLSSIWFARRFPDARVIAVEPETATSSC